MKPSVQRAVIRRLIEMHRDPPTEGRSTRLDIARYTDPAVFAAEQQALFRRHPIMVAHVSELAEPGDCVTETVAGVPLIVLRDRGGEVRVFVNACRHRGARLLDASCSGRKALTCPYHAWSYRLDGSLLHVPGRELFGADFDPEGLALRPVSHAVRHGFVFVRLDGGIPPIEDYLGATLDDDFDGFGFADHTVRETSEHRRTANWKLVMDAFAEGYHVKALHRTSLARFFLQTALVDDLDPHVRHVGARKALLAAADAPEETWDLWALTTPFYNVFPNLIVVMHPDWASIISLLPEGVDQVRVVHRLLARSAAPDEQLARRLDRSFALIDGQVFQHEDLHIAEEIQRTLHSGANETILLGGAEEGMRLYHRAWARALGRREPG